jgi:hypothetical protein
MAVADNMYCFSYFEVGKKGSESDGFSKTAHFWNLLLPTGSFLVSADAFPPKPYLMKEYKIYNRPLTQEESIFNYRLSRA